MLSAPDRQKVSPDWSKVEGRYLPGPKKWLEEPQWGRVQAAAPNQLPAQEEPGADLVWEYVVIDGHRYAKKTTA